MPFRLCDRLRPVPAEILAHLQNEGLRAAPVDGLAQRLEAVEDLLRHVPDLASIVATTVRVIHPLVAEPGYDVSHSQPKWCDLIFVSFPDRRDQIGDLRLAESVVHETMHLHLTNEEARTPLVANSESSLYSPWMDSMRSAQGVLHGVFVFQCIGAFLVRLARSDALSPDTGTYAASRFEAIREQLAAVDSSTLNRALTPHGVALVQAWAAETLDCP